MGTVISFNPNTDKPFISINPDFIKIHENNLNFEIMGFEIKVQNRILDIYRIAYYEIDNTEVNRKIKKIKRGLIEYLENKVKEIETIESDLNMVIPTDTSQYNLIPSIDIIDETKFFYGISKNNTIYFNEIVNGSSIQNLELSDYNSVAMPFLISLQDDNNDYLNTIVLFNNLDNNNPYLYESVNFREIVSESNILSIQNSNNNIKIKNTGDITIQDIVSINKSNQSTTFEKLVIKTDNSVLVLLLFKEN